MYRRLTYAPVSPPSGLLAVLLIWMFCQTALAQETLQVEVHGVEGELRENVLQSLRIARYAEAETISGDRVRLLHRRAAEDISRALQPFGYYAPSLESELDRSPDGWRATYRIDPGAQVKLGTVDVQVTGAGGQDAQFRELVNSLPLRQGAGLNHADYEQAKTRLENLAVERGYFDARFTRHEIRVHAEKRRADVALHFDTGPRYQFGPVSFDQQTFDPGFLQRYVPFEAGAPYSARQLLELQTGLLDSAYFSSVTVSPQREAAVDSRVPVEVALDTRPPNLYLVGLGYGTDTGARGRLGWERRWINRRGHRISLDAELSERKDEFTARYVMPLRDPRTERRTYTVARDEIETDTSTSEIGMLGVSYIHNRGGWQESVSLNYREERFTVGADRGRSTLLMPGIGWARTRADNPIFTRSGHRFTLDLTGATEEVVSDTSFTQALFSAKFVYGLGRRDRILLRGQAGYTWVDDFDALPPSVRFFAGGDRSVRAYDYQALGPTDAAGNVIGGRYLLAGSVEYDRLIRDKLGVAVFYDAGNAMNDLSLPLKHGAGFGFRYRSPVGLIRLDFASALSRDGNPWRVHLVIGPDL